MGFEPAPEAPKVRRANSGGDRVAAGSAPADEQRADSKRPKQPDWKSPPRPAPASRVSWADVLCPPKPLPFEEGEGEGEGEAAAKAKANTSAVLAPLQHEVFPAHI